MKLLDIKILTEENISPKVAEFPRDICYDVLDVKEQRWYGREDEALLNIACRDHRFGLTHDSEFGILAINFRRR